MYKYIKVSLEQVNKEIHMFAKGLNQVNLTNKIYFLKPTFLLLFFIIVITLSGCKTIYNSGFVRPPVQPISDSIKIGPEWIEIIPPKPLIPYGKSQYILIGFPFYDRKNYSSDANKGEVLNLADGRKTKIESFIYDEIGNSYELQISGTGGNIEDGMGFSLGPKLFVIEKNGSQEYDAIDFPKDQVFTKLKIRSEILLNSDRIEWRGRNPK